MLLPINPGSRQYTLGFSNNYLVRGVIKALKEQGSFLSHSTGHDLPLTPSCAMLNR